MWVVHVLIQCAFSSAKGNLLSMFFGARSLRDGDPASSHGRPSHELNLVAALRRHFTEACDHTDYASQPSTLPLPITNMVDAEFHSLVVEHE
jgi:hypothetical protein